MWIGYMYNEVFVHWTKMFMKSNYLYYMGWNVTSLKGKKQICAESKQINVRKEYKE
jgi:hypothetical protein